MTPHEQRWGRSSDVAFIDEGSRVVVLKLGQPEGSRPQLLQKPAAEVWRKLTTPMTAEEVAAVMEQNADFASTRAGVAQMLLALESLGLCVRQ